MRLLDTNICVAHLNGDPRVAQSMQSYSAELAVQELAGII